MPEDNTPAVEQGTGTPMDQIPTDFRGYDHWRRTGELPKAEEAAPPATAPESAPQTEEPSEPVKTAPDSEPEETQETAPAHTPSRPNSRQRKIDRLTRENAELQQRLQALTQQVPSPPPAPAPQPTGEPEIKDHTTLESYTKAMARHEIEQWKAKLDAEQTQRAAEAAERAERERWAAKEAISAQRHPDYRELMDATEIPVGPGALAARQALLEEDNGAEILYHLVNRPEELQRIAALTPARAVMEIGKLAAQLAPSPDTPKPQVTRAPRPPSPLSHGTAKTSEDIYDEDFARRDYKAWEKRRVAQLKG